MKDILNKIYGLIATHVQLSLGIEKYFYARQDTPDMSTSIEDIQIITQGLLDYYYDEEPSGIKVDDEEDAARFIVELFYKVTDMMMAIVSPEAMMNVTREINASCAHNILDSVNHNGIDTIDDIELTYAANCAIYEFEYHQALEDYKTREMKKVYEVYEKYPRGNGKIVNERHINDIITDRGEH